MFYINTPLPQQLQNAFCIILISSLKYIWSNYRFYTSWIFRISYFSFLLLVIDRRSISVFFYCVYELNRHCCGVIHYDHGLHVQQKCVPKDHFCQLVSFLLSMVHMLQHSCILQVHFVYHNRFQNLQYQLGTNGHPFRKLKVLPHHPKIREIILIIYINCDVS